VQVKSANIAAYICLDYGVATDLVKCAQIPRVS